MRTLITALAFLTSLSSCGLIKKRSKIAFTSGGSYILPVDSNVIKDVHIVSFGQTIGVVFPEEYGKERFKDSSSFTPDTSVIQKIDHQIDGQYYEALLRFNMWKFSFNGGDYSDTGKVVVSPKLHKSIEQITNSLFYRRQKRKANISKQYTGYVASNGDKILRINLVDFTEDPHVLKPYITRAWIDGWHGWYYSNLELVYYNLNTNHLTFAKL